MTTGGPDGGFGFGHHDDFAPRPRRRVWWPVALAVLVVLGFVAAVVVYESGRDDGLDDELSTERTTTTFEGSPIPSGSGDPGGVPAAEQSTCRGIPQAFPLPARNCRITSPSGLDPDEKVPAVILLHGFNTPSEDVASHGGWREAAARDQFVLVLPEGQGGSWNAGGCCGLAQKVGLDDNAYLRAVLDQVVELPHVDPARVYVVGESNGGMMAYTFGCIESARIAGVASVEGTPVSACDPARPIPIMHVHGRNDLTVPYQGGQSLISWVLGTQFQSVQGGVAQVAQAMGCQAVPDTTSTEGAVTTDDWTNCPDGVKARLVSIAGVQHEWPVAPTFDTTTEILRFMGVGG